MSDGVEYSLIGLDDLLGKLDAIEEDIRFKGGRFALRKAANVVRDRAKGNAQRIDDPGTANSIADNIAVRWSSRTFKTTGDLKFRVGVLGGARGYAKASGELKGSGKSNPGGDTYYWRYKEFGTEKMPADPFLRKSLPESIDKATDEFISHYGKSVDRAIKRAKKRKAK